MPNLLKQIPETMRKQGIPEETIAQFDFAEKGGSEEVPLTFCGCCGGHIRNNYQKSLGVKLRLKEIVSSSSSSNGKKRCEFLYEVESEPAK